MRKPFEFFWVIKEIYAALDDMAKENHSKCGGVCVITTRIGYLLILPWLLFCDLVFLPFRFVFWLLWADNF
jgi:hypothetical protein